MDPMTDQSEKNNDVERRHPPKKSSLGIVFWSLVLGTVACDLLSLCHFMPTHSQNLARPYMMSMVPFKVFK